MIQRLTGESRVAGLPERIEDGEVVGGEPLLQAIGHDVVLAVPPA